MQSTSLAKAHAGLAKMVRERRTTFGPPRSPLAQRRRTLRGCCVSAFLAMTPCGARRGAALLLPLPLGAACAAQWAPVRPVRLIVPFPPGGAVDTITRIVATGLP